MATLAERCKEAGLSSAAELTRITGTSKETLTNWMKDKPTLFEVVLQGAMQSEKNILAKRFIQLFEKHGVHRNQIPEFFGHGLTFSDVDDYKKLSEKLTLEVLKAVCELFKVRLQWLQGVDNTVYKIHDFYKHPQCYTEFLTEILRDKKHHQIFAKLIISTDAYDAESGDTANAVLVLEEDIGYIHDEPIYRYHVCGNWNIKYWKCKPDLTACIAMTLKQGIHMSGEKKSANIAAFSRGEGFMGDLYSLPLALERDGLFKKKLPEWYPDDWIYKPDSFLEGIDEGKFGKASAIQRWLSHFDKDYLETGYPQKNARAEFALALEKYR